MMAVSGGGPWGRRVARCPGKSLSLNARRVSTGMSSSSTARDGASAALDRSLDRPRARASGSRSTLEITTHTTYDSTTTPHSSNPQELDRQMEIMQKNIWKQRQLTGGARQEWSVGGSNASVRWPRSNRRSFAAACLGPRVASRPWRGCMRRAGGAIAFSGMPSPTRAASTAARLAAARLVPQRPRQPTEAAVL